MIAPEMPSVTVTFSTSTIDIVPVQKAFSLFTRRSDHRPIHGFRLRTDGDGVYRRARLRVGPREVGEPSDPAGEEPVLASHRRINRNGADDRSRADRHVRERNGDHDDTEQCEECLNPVASIAPR